ncbi:DUF3047 domain-containing protein [Pelagibius marinus]|uniref:DUF3047 domain-containing protein n=1 Tax=Pelagibius marinus TaxID=2762760 RepID=UPI0018729165|nr:DUF3047 domain-containing protein [Pelagibius marinus]
MITRAFRGGPAALALAFLTACTAQPELAREGSFDRQDLLYDPALAIEQGWLAMSLSPNGRLTDYRLDSTQDHLSIRAEGQRAASGLVLPVNVDVEACPYLEWEWRVEKLQEGASLYEADLEDVAASIWVMFGDPEPGPWGAITAPKPVPTLRYVWTTDKIQEETIIDSPSQPGVIRSIVVQGGIVSPLAWEGEKRDLAADYQAAFGGLPQSNVLAVALVTGNYHTQEPVVAHYGAARLRCSGG